MAPAIDFLGIGVQKSASKWLTRHLRQHPDLWLPPIKELHYFDRSTSYPSPSHLASDRALTRLFSRADPDRQFRRRFRGDLLWAVRSSRADLPWVLRYYLGNIGDEWYAALFREGEGRVRGEITPAYSMLDAADVQRIRSLFPGLRVILILRNPIDRAWSHLRFLWEEARLRTVDQALEKVREFVDSDRQSLRSDYNRTLDIWGACFPAEQLFVGFYDDVALDPEGLLFSIFDFLGVDRERFTHRAELHRRFNVSRSAHIPAEIERYLAARYHLPLQRLSARIGGHAERWLSECERLLGSTRPAPEN